MTEIFDGCIEAGKGLLAVVVIFSVFFLWLRSELNLAVDQNQNDLIILLLEHDRKLEKRIEICEKYPYTLIKPSDEELQRLSQ